MSYDRLAPYYAFLESVTFGRALQTARCAPLEDPAPKRVLVLGDGNGRFLERAVEGWSEAEFVSVERSAGMLRQAKMRVSETRVTFVQTDVSTWLEDAERGSFDAVVTHFFLDCFPQDALERLVPAIGDLLTQEGVWYIGEFTGGARWQRGVLWLMYRFFGTFTETGARSLPDHRAILRSRGWVSERLVSWRSGFVAAERWRRSAA